MRKGFIGPIGDDIPSIFPIMAGIILFIATLIYTNNEFNSKVGQIQLRTAGLDLSYIVMEKGLIDTTTFNETCKDLLMPSAQKDGVKFAIILRNCNQLTSESLVGTPICYQTNDNAIVNSDYLSTKTSSTFNYPVATDCETDSGVRIGLGSVTIVTWT